MDGVLYGVSASVQAFALDAALLGVLSLGSLGFCGCSSGASAFSFGSFFGFPLGLGVLSLGVLVLGLPLGCCVFSVPSSGLSLFGGLPLGLVVSSAAGLDLGGSSGGLYGLGLKLLDDAFDCIYGKSLTSSPKCVATISFIF